MPWRGSAERCQGRIAYPVTGITRAMNGGHIVRLEKAGFAAALLIPVAVAASDGGDASIERFKPRWTVGQTWNVQVAKPTEPRELARRDPPPFVPGIVNVIYGLRVEDVRTIEGEACYQLRIQCVEVDGGKVSSRWFYRAFFRKDDCTLKTVQRLARQTGQIEASRSFPRGPASATDWVGILPMEWPVFDAEESRSTDEVRQTCRVVDRLVQGKKSTALLIELERTVYPESRTVLTWVPGLPWWSEATHERNGRQWCSARAMFPRATSETDASPTAGNQPSAARPPSAEEPEATRLPSGSRPATDAARRQEESLLRSGPRVWPYAVVCVTSGLAIGAAAVWLILRRRKAQ